MNTRFSVATHILVYLQRAAGTAVTSDEIAGSVNTNPALIRRLMSQLSKAGLVAGQRGVRGGSVLVRSADSITLLDVYNAVEEEQQILPIHDAPNVKCPVGRNIQATLGVHTDDVERAMQTRLAGTTIGELAQDVSKRERRKSK